MNISFIQLVKGYSIWENIVIFPKKLRQQRMRNYALADYGLQRATSGQGCFISEHLIRV